MKTNRLYIYLCAVISMIFWSLSFVWVKVIYKYYQPFTTVFLRLLISSILLNLIYFLNKNKEKIDKIDYKYFLMLAFFEPFCYFMGESFGMLYVSSTISAIIISTIPVLTPFFAFLILKEKCTFMNFIGLLISFVGVLMIVLNKDLTFEASLKGIILLLFAVISGIAYSLVAKKLTNKYSPFSIVRFQNSLGALYFLPFFIIFDFNKFINVAPNLELIFTLLELAIFPSTLAFLLFTIPIRELGVNKTSIFVNFIPVFTAIFAYYILGEILDIQKIIGMIIVFIGLLLSQFNYSPKKFLLNLFADVKCCFEDN